MLELMNPVGLEVGEARRREVALETMRASRTKESESQYAPSAAMMLVAQPVGTERPAPSQKMQTSLRLRLTSPGVDLLTWRPAA